MTAHCPRPRPRRCRRLPTRSRQLIDAERRRARHPGAPRRRPAFELIMRRHNRRLFRLARSLVRSDAEAEDVLQEAYLRAYARLGELARRRGRSRPGSRGSSPTRRWAARRSAARVVSLEEHRARAGRDGRRGRRTCGRASLRPAGPGAAGRQRRAAPAARGGGGRAARGVPRRVRAARGRGAEHGRDRRLPRDPPRDGEDPPAPRPPAAAGAASAQRLLPLSPSLFEFQGERCDRVVAGVLARLDRPATAGARPGRSRDPGPGARPRPRRLARPARWPCSTRGDNDDPQIPDRHRRGRGAAGRRLRRRHDRLRARRVPPPPSRRPPATSR